MHPVRRRTLIRLLVILSALGVAAALILFALRDNISLFYTPTEAASGQAPVNKPLRMGGMVVKGSIKRHPGDLLVEFDLTDYKSIIHVRYRGILPDLFREEQGIVAQGLLMSAEVFQASEVLAKHDANYMPPEVKAALKKNKDKAL